MIRAAALWLALALPAGAEVIVAGLSQAQVQITANFSGEEILVFGASRPRRWMPAASSMR